MVKNKKLSKSSVAIIVLALLLIASLVMGMTGAWFTNQKQAGDSEQLKFGQINVTISPDHEHQTDLIQTQLTNFMPGDEIGVSEVVIQNEGEDAYVLFKYALKLEYKVGEGEWVTVAVDSFKAGALGTTNANLNWLNTGAAYDASTGGYVWAKFAKNDKLTFNAVNFKMDTAVNNFVYDNGDAHKQYVLNWHDDGLLANAAVRYDNGTPEDDTDDITYAIEDLRDATIRLSCNIEVYAIQARNIETAELANALSYLNGQAAAWLDANAPTQLEALPGTAEAYATAHNGVTKGIITPATPAEPADPENP